MELSVSLLIDKPLQQSIIKGYQRTRIKDMGRGGKRDGSGRPKADAASSKVVRIPFDVDKDLMLDCYHALMDANANRSDARTYDALNKILDSVFGISN
jgi:hypothetical protein